VNFLGDNIKTNNINEYKRVIFNNINKKR